MSWDNMYKEVRSKKPLVWPEIQMIRLASRVNIDSKSRVLDLGCGEGRNIRYFLENNCDVVGIEENEEALRILKSLYEIDNDKLICSDAKTALNTFSENHFDLVVCWGVMQYLDEPEAILQEIGRVLKKRAHLIISFTSEQDERERADTVKNFYSEDKIKKLIEKNNFEAINFGKVDNHFVTEDKTDSYHWFLLQNK